MKGDERNTHPGWAIQFADGTWLCANSMVFDQVDDAFYATIFYKREEAEQVEDRIHDYLQWDPNDMQSHSIVLAWEPLCEVLRLRNAQLNKTCNIAPRIFDETIELLTEAIDNLRDASVNSQSKTS